MTTPTPDQPNSPTSSRGGNGRYTRTIAAAERARRACELRSLGWTYQAIGDELFNGDRASAHHAVTAALRDVTKDAAEQLVALELDRLDALTREVIGVLEREHLVSSAGRLVLGPDGQPLRDDMPRLHAVDRLLRIMERRSRLLGLDAPTKHAVATNDGSADVDAAVAALSAEFELNEQRIRAELEADIRRELENEK